MLADLLKNTDQNKPQYSTESLMVALEHFNHVQDNFEHLVATMEELEELEDTIETLQGADKVSETETFMVHSRLQDLGDTLGVDSVNVSLEDATHDPHAYLAVSMEAVSGMWNRIKQLYVADFQQGIDAWVQLFSTADGWGRRQQGRIHKLRQEWRAKKPELNEKRHKSSLAGTSLPQLFALNGRFSTDPVNDLANDYQYAKYISNQYPKDLAVYLERVRSILGAGVYDSSAKFESTVLEKMIKLDHPSTVFKGKGVGEGNVLLGNRGLEIKKGRGVKPVSSDKRHQALADLCVKTYVKEYVFTWANLNSGVLEDFYFTTDDVDKMLDHADAYCQLIIDAKTQFAPLTRAFKNLANSTNKMNNIDGLDPVNKKVFKQVLSFTRGLTRYSKTPYRIELNRIMNLVPGIRILASRTIATSK